MSDNSTTHQAAMDALVSRVTATRPTPLPRGEPSKKGKRPRGGRHEKMHPLNESQKLIVMLAVANAGPGDVKWTMILKENMAAFPEGRSPASLRHAYYRMKNGSHDEPKNKCRKCGNSRKGHICFKKLETEAIAKRESARVAIPMFTSYVQADVPATAVDSANATPCA